MLSSANLGTFCATHRTSETSCLLNNGRWQALEAITEKIQKETVKLVPWVIRIFRNHTKIREGGSGGLDKKGG